MDVRTRIGPQPKVYLRAPFESGNGVMRIKVEMNTFERSPSRDLVRIHPDDLVDCFGPYRPEGYTHRRAEQNPRSKVADVGFREDLPPLVATWPDGYDIDTAAELLITDVLSLL